MIDRNPFLDAFHIGITGSLFLAGIALLTFSATALIIIALWGFIFSVVIPPILAWYYDRGFEIPGWFLRTPKE